MALMNDSLGAVGEAPELARLLRACLRSPEKREKITPFTRLHRLERFRLVNHRKSYGSKADAYIFVGFIPHDYSISSVIQGCVISSDVAGIITERSRVRVHK